MIVSEDKLADHEDAFAVVARYKGWAPDQLTTMACFTDEVEAVSFAKTQFEAVASLTVRRYKHGTSIGAVFSYEDIYNPVENSLLVSVTLHDGKSKQGTTIFRGTLDEFEKRFGYSLDQLKER